MKLWGGAVRHRAAARWPTSTTPAGSPSSSASSTTSSTSATTSTRTSSSPTSPPTPRGARPTRASSATATSSSTACCAGPTRSASTRSPPATTPASSTRADGARRLRPGRRPRQGPVLRALHARPGRARRACCSRSATLTKAEVRAEAAPARAAHRRQARQPGRLLHHRHRRAGRRSSATASRCTPGTVVDAAGPVRRHVAAVELVTVGQRRGLGLPGRRPTPRYVVDVDVPGGHGHRRGSPPAGGA